MTFLKTGIKTRSDYNGYGALGHYFFNENNRRQLCWESFIARRGLSQGSVQAAGSIEDMGIEAFSESTIKGRQNCCGNRRRYSAWGGKSKGGRLAAL